MDEDLAAILDFVSSNRQRLAGYLRQKLIGAGAKEYLDALGKTGIEAQEREAAGVLLDLACALLRRLRPDRDIRSENALHQLPEGVRRTIHLPRSDAYYAVLAKLDEVKRRSVPNE